MAAARVRVFGCVGNEGEREQGGFRVLLILQGGPARGRASWGGGLGGAASASRGTRQRAVREEREEKIFAKPPGSSFFICKMVQ